MTRPFDIVLVHGAFADASGWESVYQILKKDGFKVTVVQNSTESLTGDVSAVKRAVSAQPRPVILVGHSYGGAVITEAGNDPNVAGLVYVAGWVPDAGESVQALLRDPEPGESAGPIVQAPGGFVFVDNEKFPASFAGDVDEAKGRFMADAQVPWGVAAFTGTITSAAWKTKPSWYLVTTADKMIPPSLQRFMAKRAGMTIVEANGSHAVFMSKPDVVAELIEQAADAVGAARTSAATSPGAKQPRPQR